MYYIQLYIIIIVIVLIHLADEHFDMQIITFVIL